MPDLSAAATLDLWEAAGRLGPVERALALAAVAEPAEVDELARLPLGRRDALILRLAGRALEATATCPACGETAEFSVDTAALLARDASAALDVGVQWRPVDSTDLAAASEAPDAAAAERVLLERCVTSEVELSDDVRAELAEAMAAADPLAEVLVDVVCPACETHFVADLDVSSFVWAEVHARAQRLLRDVDVLARAYGWTEAEVLALGDRRREAYLALAEGST
jgi:hypothetical protein